MRTIRYHEIADTIRGQISRGEFAAGQVLPSEAELGTRHEASRVTIRKALELLRSDGLIDSRQGFGWFVASEPVPQPLNVLDTIEAQLADSGRFAERRVLDFGFVDSPPPVAPLLGSRCLEVRRLNLADGRPFARVTVWCREDLGAQLSKAAVEQSSFQELVPVSITGATQRIGAGLAGDHDADLLEVAPESPTLVVNRVTVDALGEVVFVSEHVFPGHLTEFVVHLSAGSSLASGAGSAGKPVDGIRLVDSEPQP